MGTTRSGCSDMQVLLGLLLCAVLSSADVPRPTQILFLDQTTDHFNFHTEPETFQQRVLFYDSFLDVSRPDKTILFYCGNEGDIFEFYDNTGWVFDVATELNALIVFAEHRFYGVSFPAGESSLNTTLIGLLSVEQALADFATVVEYVRNSPKFGVQDAPVVAVGGSYGGMLAAWFRMKYPHLAHMALAASAPLRMVSQEVDDFKYFEAVTNTFGKASPSCPATVRNAFSRLLELTSAGDFAAIRSAFNLCDDITSSEVEHLILWVQNAFTSLAMCDYPYPTNFLAPLPAFPVRVACQRLEQAPDLLTGLAAAATLFYGNASCNAMYTQFIECADQTGCGTGSAGIAWDYQVCSQLVYYPSTNNVTDMYPPRNFTPKDHHDYCVNQYKITPRPTWLRTAFGGSHIANTTSNIIFSNGLLDPWSVGGFLTNLSDTLVAVTIEDGAHHLDLRSSNPDDPQSVITARKMELALLKQWLAEARKETRVKKAVKRPDANGRFKAAMVPASVVGAA
eukprot:c2691_g1_i1.p1 GENE.c2691_g1_i1~~c2691_g1_i1.p1  ORF type:complete len:510 (-),score=98.65 c2691_g1_i1:143-1672(-)